MLLMLPALKRSQQNLHLETFWKTVILIRIQCYIRIQCPCSNSKFMRDLFFEALMPNSAPLTVLNVDVVISLDAQACTSYKKLFTRKN